PLVRRPTGARPGADRAPQRADVAYGDRAPGGPLVRHQAPAPGRPAAPAPASAAGVAAHPSGALGHEDGPRDPPRDLLRPRERGVLDLRAGPRAAVHTRAFS